MSYTSASQGVDARACRLLILDAPHADTALNPRTSSEKAVHDRGKIEVKRDD